MNAPLRDVRIALLERPRSSRGLGYLSGPIARLLEGLGARVDVVHPERRPHRLDAPLPWHLAILKSGSSGALHLAAAAEAWGIPCVNPAEATRLAQDKVASAVVLSNAGLPFPGCRAMWLGSAVPDTAPFGDEVVLKAQRGSLGMAVWKAKRGQLPDLVRSLPKGPYLLMDWIPHWGEDLKVYAAGRWMAGIRRPFPARTLEEKRGRSVPVPGEAAAVARETGRLLGLRFFGCDFVEGPEGWVLVDVNAFPGYKGASGAAEAIVHEIAAMPVPSREGRGGLVAGSTT